MSRPALKGKPASLPRWDPQRSEHRAQALEHSFVHLTNILLSACYLPDAVLGGRTQVKSTDADLGLR